MVQLTPEQLKSLGPPRKKAHKRLIDRLKKEKNGKVDALFQEAHEDVFAQTDCLQCANCCKTTGPLFTNKDIDRIAGHLRMKPAQFITQYLRIDEDDDYVLQQVPCTFLEADNTCSIYDVAPRACREYPHTDRVKQHQLFGITRKNAMICPAVFNILEQIKEKIDR